MITVIRFLPTDVPSIPTCGVSALAGAVMYNVVCIFSLQDINFHLCYSFCNCNVFTTTFCTSFWFVHLCVIYRHDQSLHLPSLEINSLLYGLPFFDVLECCLQMTVNVDFHRMTVFLIF